MNVLCVFVCVVLATNPRVMVAGDNTDEVPEMESRIVDGELAPEGAHPYLVGLIIKKPDGDGVCGSSLLSATRLVTTAHCVKNATSLVAVLGSLQLNNGGTRVETKVFVIHPQYESGPHDYDIAYVVLPEAVQFTNLIQPISLPNTPEEVEVVGEWAVTAGWGVTSADQDSLPPDNKVHQLRVQIVSADECKTEYGWSLVNGTTVCASSNGIGATCGGDSGGPLVVERNNRKILVGVYIYGSDFCNKTLPMAFTRVATYLQFLQQNNTTN